MPCLLCHSTLIFWTDFGFRGRPLASRSGRRCCRRGRRPGCCRWKSCGLNEVQTKVLGLGRGGYGSRFAPMQANTWEAGPAAAPELFSDRKACRKVLKHGQLKMCQFRTVSRSTCRGSLGKKMGKLLGKSVQKSDNWPKGSLADFMHVMYMPQGLWSDKT